MRKNPIYLILSFGLFLIWLLSFFYNGLVLNIVFKSNQTNIGYFAIAYVLVPSIPLFFLKLYNIEEKYNFLFMKYGIIICFAGMLLSMLINLFYSAVLIYILVSIIGVFSMLFIIGWGCHFVKLLDIRIMYKYMAYAICLGNIFFYINKFLEYQGLNNIIVLSLFLSLLGAYYFTSKLPNTLNEKRQTFNIELPLPLLVMICFMMFLLNIGGGMFQKFVSPLIESNYANIYLFNVSVFVIVGISIYKTKKKIPSETALTIAIILIACGYLLLLVFTENPIPSYAAIVVGYTVLNIFLWTLVAEMGYIFERPARIFAFVIASNLMAVFAGNHLGMFLAQTNEQKYLAIALTVICTIITFAFLPFINSFLQKGMYEVNDIITVREAVKGVVTENKAVKLLTVKELEIFKLMVIGMKNREIAEKACISDNTLKWHAKKIYSKFGVTNKKELLCNLEKEEISL